MTNTAWHEGDAIDEGVILVQVDSGGLDDRRDSRRVQKEDSFTVNGSERFSTAEIMFEIT
jgi:hypothetical protein